MSADTDEILTHIDSGVGFLTLNRPKAINSLTQTFTRGVVSAERVFKILDTLEETHLTDGRRPPALRGHIRFENVAFSYGEDVPAVSDLTLEAMPGQTIALVGATGAGKSTVLNLLTRFY